MGDRADQPVLVPLHAGDALDGDAAAMLRATSQMVLDAVLSASASASAIESFDEYVGGLRELLQHVGPYAVVPWSTNPWVDPRVRTTFMLVSARYVGVLGVDLSMEQLPSRVRAQACVHAPNCPPGCAHQSSHLAYADVRAHGACYTRTLVFDIVVEYYGLGAHIGTERARAMAPEFADFASRNLGQFSDHRGRWFAHQLRSGHPVFADFACARTARQTALLPLPWLSGAVSCPVAGRAHMTAAERAATGIVDTDSGGCFVVPSASGTSDKRPLDFLQPAIDVTFTSIKKDGRRSCTLHKLNPATDGFSRTLNTVTLPAQDKRARNKALIEFSASWLGVSVPVLLVFCAFGVGSDHALLAALGFDHDRPASAERALAALQQLSSGALALPARRSRGYRSRAYNSFGDYQRSLERRLALLPTSHPLVVAARRIAAEVGEVAAVRVMIARIVLAIAARKIVYTRDDTDLQDAADDAVEGAADDIANGALTAVALDECTAEAKHLVEFDERITELFFDHVSGPLERLALLRHMCVRVLGLLDGEHVDEIDDLGNKQQVGVGRVMTHTTLLAVRQAVVDWTTDFAKRVAKHEQGISLANTAVLDSLLPPVKLGSSAVRLRSVVISGVVQQNNAPIYHVTATNPTNPNEAVAYAARVHMKASISEDSSRHTVPATQRSVHTSQYGYLDPAHTPDGKSVGQCNHRALLARFTTALPADQRAELVEFIGGRHRIAGQESQLVMRLDDLRALEATESLADGLRALLAPHCADESGVPVHVDGAFVGRSTANIVGVVARWRADHWSRRSITVAVRGGAFDVRTNESPLAGVLRAHLAGLGARGSAEQSLLLANAARGAAYIVLVDGAPIGLTLAPSEVAAAVRRWRTERWERRYVEVVHDIARETVEVLTGNGRFTRIVYSVARTSARRTYAVQLSRRIIAATGDAWIAQRRIGLRALYLAGLITFLGPRETQYALIATGVDDPRLAPNYAGPNGVFTHIEVNPLAVLGFGTALEPFPDHTQAPRAVFSNAQKNSTVGSQTFAEYAVPHISWQLLYPQRRLVITAAEAQPQVAGFGNAVTLVIAVAARLGNQEDSLIFARGASERGAGAAVRSTRTSYEEVRGAVVGRVLHDIVFANPLKPELPPDVVYGGPSGAWNGCIVGDDGLPEVGCVVADGNVLIGRVTFEMGPKGLTAVDVSIVHRGPAAVVRAVHLTHTRNNDEARLAIIDLDRYCPFEVGCKGIMENAQKGVVSELVDPANQVYIVSSNPALHGTPVDAIINPHSQPSRMTICNLLQLCVGFLAVASGRRIQATAFARTTYSIDTVARRSAEPPAPYNAPVYIDWDDVAWAGAPERGAEPVASENQRSGLDPFGLYLLANPHTGHPLGEPGRPTEHAIGIVTYDITHHRVDEKAQSTTRAKRDALGLVCGGRKNDGGLRFGEMERDCMITHGAANMLKNYTCTNSDGADVYICATCGHLAYMHARTRDLMCTHCRTGAKVGRAVIPIAARLLMQELRALGIAARPRFESRRAEPEPLHAYDARMHSSGETQGGDEVDEGAEAKPSGAADAASDDEQPVVRRARSMSASSASDDGSSFSSNIGSVFD